LPAFTVSISLRSDHNRVPSLMKGRVAMKSRIDADSLPSAQSPDRAGMVWIPGGTFNMGSDTHYAEEYPIHPVTVDGFWMDRCAVTNQQWSRFADTTGYLTVAERILKTRKDPASLVFRKPK